MNNWNLNIYKHTICKAHAEQLTDIPYLGCTAQ